MISIEDINLLLHIGYHKTGSSWLQEHLFRNEEVGFCTPFNKSRDLAEYLIAPNSLDFDLQAAQEYFYPKLREVADRNLVPVVTSERLSGSPHSGGFDTKDIAERLVRVFPNAKVLVVLREQKSMILSTYRQYVRGGGRCTIRHYLEPLPDIGGKKVPLFSYNYFEYHRLISLYYDLFGKENMLILTYEQFRKVPLEFANAITSLAGVKKVEQLPFSDVVNVAESPFAITLMRRFSFVAKRSRVNPSVMFDSPRLRVAVREFIRVASSAVPKSTQNKIEAGMKKEIADLVGDRYKASNRKVAEMTGLDLGRFGYDM